MVRRFGSKPSFHGPKRADAWSSAREDLKGSAVTMIPFALRDVPALPLRTIPGQYLSANRAVSAWAFVCLGRRVFGRRDCPRQGTAVLQSGPGTRLVTYTQSVSLRPLVARQDSDRENSSATTTLVEFARQRWRRRGILAGRGSPSCSQRRIPRPGQGPKLQAENKTNVWRQRAKKSICRRRKRHIGIPPR
jgi:hypothetical protein